MRISTKEKIANSLDALLKTKSFTDISVGDICDNIDISRTTFYRHFQDKYECMNWIYQTQIHRILDKNQEIEDWKSLIYDVIYFMYERRDFFVKVSSYKEQNSLMECIYECGYNYLQDMLLKELQIGELPPELHWSSCMYMKGSVFLLESWLRNGCKESPDFIVKLQCENIPLKISQYFN